MVGNYAQTENACTLLTETKPSIQHTTDTTSKIVGNGKAMVTTSFHYSPQNTLQMLRPKLHVRPAPTSQLDSQSSVNPQFRWHALIAGFNSRLTLITKVQNSIWIKGSELPLVRLVLRLQTVSIRQTISLGDIEGERKPAEIS